MTFLLFSGPVLLIEMRQWIFRGDGVHLANARAGLMIPTTWAFAAVDLMLCVRVMAQEVFVP